MLAWMALGCLVGAGAKPGDLTVDSVMQTVSPAPAKLSYGDEPPGKLQSIEWDGRLRGTRAAVHVHVDLVYTSALFSAERHWKPAAVRAAKVRQITIVPIPAAR